MDIHSVMMKEIQKLYDTETQLLQALTFLAQNAQSEDLRTALMDHREETQEHIRRLEEICAEMNWPCMGEQSMVTRALVQEAEQMFTGVTPSAVTDACIIGAAQKAEHLEMASYGTAAALADAMDHDNAKHLLGKTLDEEKDADKKLSKLAEHGINEAAVQQTGRASMM